MQREEAKLKYGIVAFFVIVSIFTISVYSDKKPVCKESVIEKSKGQAPSPLETNSKKNQRFSFSKCLSEGDEFGNYGGDGRYQYNHPYLSPTSIVFEVGGNQGKFTAAILRSYNPIMYTFEPIKYLYEKLNATWYHNRKFHVFHYGLAPFEGELKVSSHLNVNDERYI
jgi:hypothetical protein